MGTGIFVGPDSGVFVGFVVGAGVFVGPDLGVFVGSGTLVSGKYRVAVGKEGLSSNRFGSTVAFILEVDSAGAGAALEQASTRLPTSTARTTDSFIPFIPQPSGLGHHPLHYHLSSTVRHFQLAALVAHRPINVFQK